MSRVTATVWLCPVITDRGVWSPEAVAGLVGQDVKMHGDTISGKHIEFAATVTGAQIREEHVTVDLAIPSTVTCLAPIDSDWWNQETTGHYCAPPPS